MCPNVVGTESHRLTRYHHHVPIEFRTVQCRIKVHRIGDGRPVVLLDVGERLEQARNAFQIFDVRPGRQTVARRIRLRAHVCGCQSTQL